MKQSYFLFLLWFSYALFAMEQGIGQGKNEKGESTIVTLQNKFSFRAVLDRLRSREATSSELPQITEEKPIIKPATLLASIGLKSEEANFSMLVAQLERMPVAKYNDVLKKHGITEQNISNPENYQYFQRILLQEMIKHLSIVTMYQKRQNNELVDLVRRWKLMTLAMSASFVIVMSFNALVAAVGC
jgi:hypothetical protein